MGFLDRLFGGSGSPQPAGPSSDSPLTDEQALQRYRYLLRTAPPETIEQAHAEAFAQLTPEQRSQALKQLSQELPASERTAGATQADAQSLARLATRAELRQPGTLERTFGGGGMGLGGMFGGSLLSSIAGAFIGTAIAHEFLGGFHGGWGSDAGHMDEAHASADSDDGGDDFSDSGGDVGGDFEDV